MKDTCSYRFDAILAVALEQDARQELAARGRVARRALDVHKAALAAQRPFGTALVEPAQVVGPHRLKNGRAARAAHLQRQFVQRAGGDLAGLHRAQRPAGQAQRHQRVILGQARLYAAIARGAGGIERAEGAHALLGVAGDPGEQIERVRAEVQQHAALQALLPAHGAIRVDGAGVQVADGELGDLAQRPFVRQLL